MRRMVAANAHTPRENTLRPFFSWTTQCSPAALTRRVRGASPGGSSNQPSRTVQTPPSRARTVFGVGPGVKVVLLIALTPPCVVTASLTPEFPPTLNAQGAHPRFLSALRSETRAAARLLYPPKRPHVARSHRPGSAATLSRRW